MSITTEVPTSARKMKLHSFIIRSLFLIFVCIFTSSVAVKEIVEHGSLKDHASLIYNLIKRLGEPSYNYQPPDYQEDLVRSGTGSSGSKQSESGSNELQNLQSVCDHVIEKGNIIKTTESIEAGAVYIDSVKYVKSNADCLGYCCQNSTCDVAVFQDKGDRYCYLFQCAGRCIFKPHTGYFVGTIKGRKSAEHPEEDLLNLNGEVPGSESGDKKVSQDTVQRPPESEDVAAPVPELTTLKVIATTQTKAPELVIAPHSVGLGGFCTLSGQCEDPSAVCGHGNCVCNDTFYNKDGMCRKVCLQSEFECFELGTLVRGPECIPRSQVCDPYLNCADGSDEFNCENAASNNQQPNTQQSGASGVNGAPKITNQADQYAQPVQEQAADTRHRNVVPQSNNPQAPYQTLNAKEMSGAQDKTGHMPPVHNFDVRPKSIQVSKDNSMHSNQNPYPGNAQPPAHQSNPYIDTPYAGNRPDSPDIIAHAPNTNQANKNLINHESLSHPLVPNNNNPASLHQANVAKPPNKASSNNPPVNSAPGQNGHHQRLDSNENRQHPQKHPQPAHQAAYADAEQHNEYAPQFIGSHNVNQQPARMPQVNNQETGLRPSSNVHPEISGNSHPQNGWHADKSPLQKASFSSSLKSSKPTNLRSQSSGIASSKTRSKIQTPIKSQPSAPDQSEPQNRLSMPGYSNSQKWIDPNLYVPYNLGESPSQQEPAPLGNHYFDSSQYYPPYSSDTLDPLPESLLENTGPSDEFSQFGGPDVGHGKSMALPSYNSQNSGYQGYPESSYGGQYPPSIRYDDNGDYRSPVYQDPDLYSSLGTQRAYRPSAGLYEDFPSGIRPPKQSTVHKVQDSEPLSPPMEQKKINEPVGNHAAQSTQAAKTESHAAKLPLEAGAGKNKTESATASPLLATHKLFPDSHSGKKHIFLSSEKVIIANTSDAEGPIIALSLGLAFTVILLVLVGCRLRNVRHRLRKGRPLHQNEADYLINGMYL